MWCQNVAYNELYSVTFRPAVRSVGCWRWAAGYELEDGRGYGWSLRPVVCLRRIERNPLDPSCAAPTLPELRQFHQNCSMVNILAQTLASRHLIYLPP